MFKTTNDADNRAAVAAAASDALDFVGIGVHRPAQDHRQGGEQPEVPELEQFSMGGSRRPHRKVEQSHIAISVVSTGARSAERRDISPR